MKDHNIWKSLEQLALGRGFYIVLALCITAVGVTGYYLYDAVTAPLQETAPANTDEPLTVPEEERTVTLPEPEPVRPVTQPQEVTLPDETQVSAQPEAVQSAAPAANEELSAPTVFTWPVQGEILRQFSVETLSPDPTMGDWRTHAGLDVAAKLGTRVLCMTEGNVAEIWDDPMMGTCIRVEHGGGLVSTYANLAAEPTVKVGDHMEIGAILGAVGLTADAESGMEPHLHLEVAKNGQSVDPMELLPEK